MESPLRKSSVPVDPDAGVILQKTRSLDKQKQCSSEIALESETEDEGIHISPPPARTSKYTGNGYDPPTEDLGPEGGNTEAGGGFIEETGYGVPILASDEVAKTPGAEFMQPAVSPAQERRGSGYYTVGDFGEYQSHRHGSRPGSAANSRPSSRPASRPGSIAGLTRFSTHEDEREMHTPLEDVDEYEPLFPDEEGNTQRKPLTVAQRLKMREHMKRFPSQDIWEDTPNSLQLEATVETPEEANARMEASKKAAFEPAEHEAARKGEVSEAEKAKLIPAEERLAKSNFKPHVLEEVDRPSMKQRFPSRDIWEDSPDSVHLETTVGEKPADEGRTSPKDVGLEAGAVVHTVGRPKDGEVLSDQPRDGTTVGTASIEKPTVPPRPIKYKIPPSDAAEGVLPPMVPERPQKKYQVPPADVKLTSPTERKGPGLPDRPKPQIPARPKPSGQDSSEAVPLSKITSESSALSDESTERDVAMPKAKPTVPARPAGSKIANLKAGFLGDLESRLKLGPQAPPKPQENIEPEVEEEKALLSDARKGRAKGPAKRKPATSATTAQDTPPKTSWQIKQAWTVWEADSSGLVHLVSATKLPETAPKEQVSAAPLQNAEPTLSDLGNEKSAETETYPTHEVSSQSLGNTLKSNDLATPTIETERNPLSREPSTTVPSVLSTTISPSSVPSGTTHEEEASPIPAADVKAL